MALGCDDDLGGLRGRFWPLVLQAAACGRSQEKVCSLQEHGKGSTPDSGRETALLPSVYPNTLYG